MLNLCLLLPLTILADITHALSLVERKMYDPYIVCHDPPPPAYSLPEGYLRRNHLTSMDLCSAANGRRNHNVGCFCSSSTSNIQCDDNVADIVLAEALTTSFNGTDDQPATMKEFCDIACFCADTRSAARARASMQRNSALNRVSNRQNSTRPYFGEVHVSTEANDDTQCGNKCSSNADCANNQNGCTCKTLSEQYVPGKGVVMFVAACMMSLGGKRDAPSPCPCNGTYVSQSCCEAVDGIVHEPEHFKLGELLRTGVL